MLVESEVVGSSPRLFHYGWFKRGRLNYGVFKRKTLDFYDLCN